MGLKLFIFLFLFTALLTIIITVILKNRGPWNNPMLFFMVLFMTTWTISIWMRPVETADIYYPFLSVAALTILISILLGAAKTTDWGINKMRTIKDREVVDVITKPAGTAPRTIPNAYFWVLILTESLLILSAYIIL